MLNKELDTVFLKPSPQSYAYFLDGDIVEPSEYRELMQVLTSMQQGDYLDLMINCFGGYLHTTIMLSGAIRSCKGHVNGILNGVAMSGGSIILLSCHSVEVMPHSTFMAHTSNGYNQGKLSDTIRSVTSSSKQLEALYRDVYYGFYTDEEISDILDGKDSYIEFEEIVSRLEKRQELFESERKAAEQSLNDMFDSLDTEIPEEILRKLTKQQLVDYLMDRIDIDIQEDGKFEILPVEQICDENENLA